MTLPDVSPIVRHQSELTREKNTILSEWVSNEVCSAILERHEIEAKMFVERYASNVFDYFMGVVGGMVAIGECPVIADLIDYLKNKDLRADELFILCTHFKRSVLNATYRLGINDQTVFLAVSYLFDRNFSSVLKLYTDTIYQKEQEALNASRAKEYFLSNMSHEIRTPLNAILGFVSLLKDESTNPRCHQYLDIISNSGENLLHIINDILDFSKLRSGEFNVDPQPFNIHDEISHTMELFVPSANSKNITLTSFIDPSIPYEMVADALRIKQILGNFLSNAIKFSPTGSAIHVEAKFGEGFLDLSVKDQGIGIALSDQERIFDAFSQAQEGSSKVHGGTGLGLSICKQLALHMGGTIRLESSPGAGSTFTLHIPVEVNTECNLLKFDPNMYSGIHFALLKHDSQDDYKLESLWKYWEHFRFNVQQISHPSGECDLLIFMESSITDEARQFILDHKVPSVAILDFLDDRYDAIPHIAPLTFPIYCTKLQNALSEVLKCDTDYRHEVLQNGRIGFVGHVLVAEDNGANQELIKIILQRYGLTYEIASDGNEAVTLFQNGTFDLIFMDEQMPRKNGNEATLEILAHERKHKLRHTPIVALTANVVKGSRERALQNGYDVFLGKPIVLKEFESVLERYLPSIMLPTSEEFMSVKEPKKQIDMDHLKAALMLDEEQIEHLLRIYRTKMERSLTELETAIRKKGYETIEFVAHSIKGSSANFRFEELSRLAYVIEDAARSDQDEFDFHEAYGQLVREYRLKLEG